MYGIVWNRIGSIRGLGYARVDYALARAFADYVNYNNNTKHAENGTLRFQRLHASAPKIWDRW
jgi:hypothetical protein